jgi:hypothetical protein
VLLWDTSFDTELLFSRASTFTNGELLLQEDTMRRSMTFFFLLLAIAVQGYCEDIYLNKKVKTRERMVQSIIILPSNTYVKRSGETGRVLKESMKSILKGPFGKQDNIPSENPEDKSDALSIEIDNIVSKVLRDRGWKVNDNAFSSEILQKDEKKKFACRSSDGQVRNPRTPDDQQAKRHGQRPLFIGQRYR